MTRPIRSLAWMLAAALVLLLACAGLQPTPPTATAPPPTASPAPPPTPIQAADDPAQYPLRYYHADASVSLEPPIGWYIEETDDPARLARIATPDGGPVFVLASAASEGKRVSELNQAYLESWLGLESVQVERDAAYTFANGLIGWERAGTLDEDRWRIVSFSDREHAFHLALRASAPDFVAVEAAFEASAHSLQIESEEPLDVPRETALVLSDHEPLTLDPALTRYGPNGLMGDLFSGLVVFDPHLQIRPALAERWDVSPDGTVYTFHLHPQARFHNGRPVTVGDVQFSWERAVLPDTGSETALLYMNDIVGVAEFHAGAADTISGVQVIDEHTLQVTIDGPKPYFLAKLSYPVADVVDRYNVGMPNWEEHPNGTGPFRHRQHIRDQVFIVERNPFFYDEPPRLEHVVYRMFAGPSRRLYENGEVDFASLTRDLRERAANLEDGLYGTLVTEPNLCTQYVTFNTSMPPFEDAAVRRAFALAVDRERYVEAITNREATAAHGLLPPGIPGYVDEAPRPDFDPQAARASLAASSYGSPQGLPPIVWTLRSSGGRYSSAAALLIDMWSDVLRVRVSVEGLDPESYDEQIDAGNFGQLLLEGWCADYPDPENFLDLLFRSGSAQNHGGYANPAFDALVEGARTEPDAALRLSLYHQAELLLLDDAPAIFLSHAGPSYAVWKPYVHGYVPSPIGVPQHYLMWIQ